MVAASVASSASDSSQKFDQEVVSEQALDELQEEVTSTVSQEEVDVEEEERKALEEALSGLSDEDLKMMAVRLSKCNGGFHEMLQEAELEREELQKEKVELNASIARAMQEVHRRREAKPPSLAERVVVKRAVETIQTINNMQSQVWTNLHQQVAQKSQTFLDKGAAFLANRKLANTEAWTEKGKKKKDPEAKLKKKAEKAAKKAAEEAKSGDAANQAKDGVKSEAKDKADTIDEAKAKLKKTEFPSESENMPEKVAAASAFRVPTTVVKRKPVVVISAAVVIEATLTITDGSSHVLNVHMTDSCEDAAKKFIQQHSQRAWFEAPLTAWLKKCEAEATKLPSRVEASLPELRKQHSKAAKEEKA